MSGIICFYCYIFVFDTDTVVIFIKIIIFIIFCVNLYCVSALALRQVFRMYIYSIQNSLHIGAI